MLPRKITITVNPSEKVYGDANPPFSVSYEGFINDDTPEDMLEGELEYKTDCDERSRCAITMTAVMRPTK